MVNPPKVSCAKPFWVGGLEIGRVSFVLFFFPAVLLRYAGTLLLTPLLLSCADSADFMVAWACLEEFLHHQCFPVPHIGTWPGTDT